MRNLKKWSFVGILLAILLLTFSSSAFCEAKVVARVGSVPITIYELSRKVQKLVPLASSFHKGISQDRIAELKKEALDDLIEKAYMVQYAFSEELSVSKDEIEEEIKPIESKFSSKKDFQKALGKESVSDFRMAIYRKLLAEKALDVAVNQKVNISEEKIRSFYDENKSRFKRPRQFRASHILVKVDPASTSESRQEKLGFAKELVSRARSGEDFYDLAYYNSDEKTKFVGGDMGAFHQGQMLPEIEKVVVEMKVGEISDPIKTLYGYSIVKLTEDNPPKQMSYEEVKPNLLKTERKKLFDELKANWLNELKDKYKLERFDS